MNHKIVYSLEPITLVGGGVAQVNDVKQALLLSNQCVAVDGGLGLVLAAGATPAAVIGDFDSVNAAELGRIGQNLLHKIVEQDSTDFEKALNNIKSPAILAVGFTGGRMDHQMAVLNALVTHRDQTIIVIGETEVVFHLPKDIVLPTESGDVVSLFPLASTSGTSDGLKWPIDGLDFAPSGKIGTSNQASGPVHLRMDAPGMLAFIPRVRVRTLVRVLQEAPASTRWTVPA
ncbi:MAG: thiamine diphosphokinase [Paracoccaceae bacterium]